MTNRNGGSEYLLPELSESLAQLMKLDDTRQEVMKVHSCDLGCGTMALRHSSSRRIAGTDLCISILPCSLRKRNV
jgi:hypothetical protein